MGKNVDIRQAKSRDPPLKQRVDGLALQLRPGVDRLCAVHGTGAPRCDDPAVALQTLFQVKPLQKAVLCRHMSARQDNHIHIFQIPVRIPVVAHVHPGNAQSAHGQGFSQAGANTVVLFVVRRVGADDQHPRVLRPHGFQVFQQVVTLYQQGGDALSVLPDGTAEGACQHDLHGVPLTSFSAAGEPVSTVQSASDGAFRPSGRPFPA